jgi:DNA uptake protein ComE-like DNA-binding protein
VTIRRADDSPPKQPAWRREAWLLPALNPFWTAWVPLVYAGRRAKRPAWVIWGGVYLAIFVGSFLLLGPPGTKNDIGAAGTLFTWLAAAIHCLVIRREYHERMSILDDPRLAAFRTAERRRQLVAELARTHPQLAEESGVGRPDVQGAFDAGLVDLNHASAKALTTLPGVDKRLAHRIVLVRDRIDGFSSLYDAGSILDLPPDLVDDLRNRVLCLPY